MLKFFDVTPTGSLSERAQAHLVVILPLGFNGMCSWKKDMTVIQFWHFWPQIIHQKVTSPSKKTGYITITWCCESPPSNSGKRRFIFPKPTNVSCHHGMVTAILQGGEHPK